ncbi:NADH-quinone oxidoreductase subunit L [Saccharomonospora piscinae]|uniref:proton-conducting transporter transmembrane domain-containing protein n=1 Tax=Saccharomonospora piscinae TaxID=687388 RepID=UPI001105C51A|nr:proton-conducting transporter membrane subunit [Saccharomonospora piscinae]TLW91951.1 NADH-quinone oxidoreductase subunit L [Saccharomonospora piscinae]
MLWLLVAIPLLVGPVLLAAGRRADSLAGALAIASTVLTLAVSVVVAVTRPAVSMPFVEGVAFALRVDGLSAILVVTVATILLVVLVFAVGEIGPTESRARFFGLVLLFAGAMLVTVTATTVVSLLMAWEVMGAVSYALIGYWWHDSRRASSGTIAFLTTRAADLGLYLAAGAALAGGATGLTLGGLAELPGGWRDVVAAGVVLAALGKSAQLPFSFWLSRAMDGPSSVSALLHSATMVAAGAYLLLRLQPLLSATGWAAVLVAWLGAFTALVLGAVALAQSELKQLLAASTCAQVGFMVLGAGAGGVAAATAQLVAHALTKSLLFLTAGAWLSASGTQRLPGLRGVARDHPLVGTAFTVGAVTLAGIPPLALWTTKDQILATALHESPPLYVVGLAAAALSAGYSARAVALVWSAPAVADRHTAPRRARRVLPSQRAALPPLAVGTTLLSVLALPGVWSAFAGIVSSRPQPTPVWWEYLLSTVLALGAAAAAAGIVRLRGDVPARPLFGDWLGLEGVARRFVTVPTLRAAEGLARFDDRVLDGGVRAAAGLGTSLARTADTRGERSIEAAVRAVADGAHGLGRLALRPQTGLLHHYYAQAVVALAVLALLLVVL